MYAQLKYILDIILSLGALIFILSWLMPIIIVLNFFTTGEHPFYFQNRIGKDGKKFKIIKFRTMVGESPKNDPLLSKDETERITRIGKILRKYRIDEFPQFINVLRGEMSVVGPRPERQFFLDQMISHLPKYKELQKLRPGITSLGQIKYGYADTIEQMLIRAKYDLVYLDNLTLWTDIKIIFATIITVIKGKGK